MLTILFVLVTIYAIVASMYIIFLRIEKKERDKAAAAQEEQAEKERLISCNIHTDYDKKGCPGYESKEIKSKKTWYGIKTSGIFFIYTGRYFSVYIDLNDFPASDIAIVKKMLIKKYTFLLDNYSDFCLEAKKNTINTLYRD